MIAGNYKTTTSSRIWLFKPFEDINSKKKKKVKNVISNPIFNTFAEYCNDTTWRDIFKSAASGKFPKGFGYKDNMLFFQRKTKVSSLSITEDDIEESLDACKNFFRNHGGITTDKEQFDNSQEETTEVSTDSSNVQINLTWSKVKPKNMKNVYLNKYLDKFSQINKLNPKQHEYLESIFNLAKSIGLLNDDNVIFNCDEIIEIKELSY